MSDGETAADLVARCREERLEQIISTRKAWMGANTIPAMHTFNKADVIKKAEASRERYIQEHEEKRRAWIADALPKVRRALEQLEAGELPDANIYSINSKAKPDSILPEFDVFIQMIKDTVGPTVEVEAWDYKRLVMGTDLREEEDLF